MAGLPGWDRDRLATAPEADVEAARWQIYAGKLEPQIRRDYPSEIRALELAEMPAKTRDREVKAQAKRDRETLRAAERHQAELRKSLMLDEAEEPDEGDE